MRLPLAIMVVFCHAFGLPHEPIIHWESLGGMDWYNILRLSVTHGICRSAVPVFFIISGYLFFLKMQQSDWAFYKHQWTKRVRTLLIPYLIWNVLAYLKSLSSAVAAVLLQGKPWSSLADALGDTLSPSMFWCYTINWDRTTILQQVVERCHPAHTQLWYVRNLMVVVLLAPLLCWLLKKTRGWLLLLLAALYVLSVQIPVPTLRDTLVYALLLFGLGAWFALCKKDFAALAARHVVWTLPVWVALVLLHTRVGANATDAGLIVLPWMRLVGAAAIMGCMARWGRVERPSRGGLIAYAANNTFFIYLSHALFGIGTARFLLGSLHLPQPVIYVFTPFLAAAICLSVLWVMKRYMPRVTAVMLGERT